MSKSHMTDAERIALVRKAYRNRRGQLNDLARAITAELYGHTVPVPPGWSVARWRAAVNSYRRLLEEREA